LENLGWGSESLGNGELEIRRRFLRDIRKKSFSGNVSRANYASSRLMTALIGFG
jgi:hypothetical protein